MTAPLAKGIVITVTVIVAAGITAYQSPEIQRWLDTSRRRIAQALHSLGDGINPDCPRKPHNDDISMTEAPGLEAEERRRKARDDLIRRRALLTEKRRGSSEGSMSSFDKLVDREGRLKDVNLLDPEPHSSAPKSSGVEISDLSQVMPVNRRQEDSGTASRSMSVVIPAIDENERRALIENLKSGPLALSIASSETVSNHDSESIVNLTPTSEFPGAEFHIQISEQEMPQRRSSDTDSLANTEDEGLEFYYAHPDSHSQATPQHERTLFDAEGIVTPPTQPSSAPSIASDLSHIENDPFETGSNASMSDLGRLREEAYTPISWTEVGSAVSSNDEDHP